MKVRPFGVSHAILVLLLGTAHSPVHASGNLILIDSPPVQDYSLSVGPGIAGYQQYPGARGLKVIPVPGVDLYFPNGAFASTDNGVGWNFAKREDMQIGLRLLPIFGRKAKASRELGLADVGARVGKDAFFTYAPWQFLILQSDVLAGSGKHRDGVQAELGATLGASIGDRALVGMTAGATWSNKSHMQSYFGVTPHESARSGLSTYSPAAGWSDTSLRLSGELQLDERWRLSGEVIGARLIRDAGASPIVRSRTQSMFSLTLWYRYK